MNCPNCGKELREKGSLKGEKKMLFCTNPKCSRLRVRELEKENGN